MFGFRAYEKATGKIHKVVNLYLFDEELDVEHFNSHLDSPYEDDTKRLSFRDVEIMQDTGFKDANGAEIYTGYIIRDLVVSPSGYEDSDENFVDTTPSNPVGVIELRDGCFVANFGDYTVPLSSTYSQADKTPITNFWEIIGNIYQNRKTLEAE